VEGSRKRKGESVSEIFREERGRRWGGRDLLELAPTSEVEDAAELERDGGWEESCPRRSTHPGPLCLSDSALEIDGWVGNDLRE